MKKVIIKKQGIQTHGAEMQDPTEWINACIQNNCWGLPDRWVQDSELSPLSDEEKTNATETREVEVMGEMVTEYFFPAEYSIEIEDITEEVEQQKANAEALAYLAETDWMMIRELENGKPMPEEVKIKRQEARDKVKK